MPKKYNEKSTLMSRMGFNDPDLKSQLHDDIILWLYQDEILREIVDFYSKSYFSEGYISNFKFIRKTLEHIVEKSTDDYSKRTYDIGFIDLSIRFYNPSANRFNLDESPFFHFEVKTSYPSLGALLRQLNMYHKYLNGFFILVGPQNKKIKDFPKILEEQGWHFVEIPEELQKTNNNPQKDLINF